MRRWIIGAAASVVVLGGGAAAQAPATDALPGDAERIRDVVWRAPAGAQLKSYYPAEALEFGLGGWVTARCTADADGRLKDCTLAQEHPKGFGFGEAALKAAPLFQAEPASLQGVPVRGKAVWFGLNFGAARPAMPCSLALLVAERRENDAAERERLIAEARAQRPLEFPDAEALRRELDQRTAMLVRARDGRPEAFARLRSACEQFAAPLPPSVVPVVGPRLLHHSDGRGRSAWPARTAC